MAFVDPQTLTVATVAKTLPRVGAGDGESKYRTSDNTFSMRVSHSNGRRTRSLLRFDQSKTAADPLITGSNRVYSQSVQIVSDRDLSGWTNQEVVDLLIAAADYLKASSNANTIKFVGGES
jgi:hypothetical protein